MHQTVCIRYVLTHDNDTCLRIALKIFTPYFFSSSKKVLGSRLSWPSLWQPWRKPRRSMIRRLGRVRRPWRLITRQTPTSTCQGEQRKAFCWPRRNAFVQGWCGETADELQHQEAADGRQQEWVRKPVAENQRASGECKREWVMRLIKDLICPPPVYHYTCDQQQIGDTTSLVTVPGCQEYQLLSLNCEIPISLSHIKNDFADWETWILQMLTLYLDHKRSHLFILRDS